MHMKNVHRGNQFGQLHHPARTFDEEHTVLGGAQQISERLAKEVRSLGGWSRTIGNLTCRRGSRYKYTM